MKIDYKKIKPIVLTYASLSAPIAIAAFAMNASGTIKLLSFLSGFLAVAGRQANPKDPFTLNILAVAKTQVDAEIAKKSPTK